MSLTIDEAMRRTFTAIRSSARNMLTDLVTIRRDLHMHPEPRFTETRTAGIAADALREIGAEVKTGVGKTGVVGILEGTAGDGPVIGIRCDMDALPIQEHGDAPYRSTVDGVMHACGHDVHTTIGIGIARVLADMRDSFPGAVKFIFQPSEENPFGAETCGSLAMIRDGVLEDPPMDGILSVHCWPDLETGSVGVNAGPAMAAGEAFGIEFTGRQAHAATPHKGRDAILGAAEFISSCHHIISRMTDPVEPFAFNIGKVEGGNAQAIIASWAKMSGTARTLSKESMDFVNARMTGIAEGVARMYDLGHEVTIEDFYPPTVNDPRLDELVTGVSRELLGTEKTVFQRECPMTAEDFAHFTTRLPCYYLKLGVANSEEGIAHALHNECFDVDERCIVTGVEVLASSAVAYLMGAMRLEG